jgi:hypothetical protein
VSAKQGAGLADCARHPGLTVNKSRDTIAPARITHGRPPASMTGYLPRSAAFADSHGHPCTHMNETKTETRRARSGCLTDERCPAKMPQHPLMPVRASGPAFSQRGVACGPLTGCVTA